MPVAICDKKVHLTPHLKDLSEGSFVRRLVWQKYDSLLRNVISETRSGIISRSKYSLDNVPDETVGEFYEAGDIVAKITTSPQGISIPWESVLGRFEDYVRFLLERYSAGIKETGVITIGGLPYAPIPHLVEKAGEYENDEKSKAHETLEAKGRGIRQTAVIVSPEKLLETVPESFDVIFRGRNYPVFSESNLRSFQLAKNMSAEGSRRTVGYDESVVKDGKGAKVRVKRFMDILLDETLGQIGLEPGQIPEQTPEPFAYPFESGRSYIHKIERRTRPAYKKILDRFRKDFPKVVRKNSVFGDFPALERMQADPELEGVLREKGLIDDHFMEDYRPKQRGGKTMVVLGGVYEDRPVGVIERVVKYRRENENPYIEQNLELDPESLLGS